MDLDHNGPLEGDNGGTKREREVSVPQDQQYWNPDGADSSRPKRTRLVTPDVVPKYLILHRVHCSRATTHSNHKAESHFFDIPKLLAGDSKASALRGKEEVMNVDDYLEDHPEIIFTVYRPYDCRKYHESVKDEFYQLLIPRLDPATISQLKPYFSTLNTDCENAIPGKEYIDFVSDDLETAIEDAKLLSGGRFAGLESPEDSTSPYLPFYHSRKFMTDILSTSNTSLTSKSRVHLSLLHKFVTDTCATDWKAADALFATGLVNKTHFFKLFGPNEVVVTNKGTSPMAYLVKSVDSIHEDRSMQLNCTSWDFDQCFRKVESFHKVEWNSEYAEIEIRDLKYYPLRFDISGLEERLRTRGKQFWACRKRAFVSYKSPHAGSDSQNIAPRYMVDNSMYKQMHPDATEEAPQSEELGEDAMKSLDPPLGSFVLLLPATIRGYGLHDKKWTLLFIENMQPIPWNKEAFERHLVLNEQKKELIRALVTVHIASSNTSTTDIIEGKGKGLIILLHGGPGTGKTLTAESVAEFVERPLYRVTCGDIGTDPEGVEKYLDSVFYIGTTWGCVVLLDEADVFLEERTQMDLQRNALVSSFLRALEYYEGILIITTNRVGTFDEAFKSRVQIALHYPSLDEDGRLEIWCNFLDTLKDEDEEFSHKELKGKLRVLARHNLNGRQIRNTINTARQLARYKKESLAYIHLVQAIDVTVEFEKYVTKTHGHSDEEWVRSQRIRY